MKTLKFVLLLFGLFTIASCVSKKKYEQLETAKRRSDMRLAEATKENRTLEGNLTDKTKEAKKLDSELAKLKEEFNDMKNEMLENNARKTSLIEDLNRKLSLLSNDHKSAKDSLQSMLARLDKKDKRYRERQIELRKKLQDLDGIEQVLNSYNEQLTTIEKFITYNIDKNGIPKTYTLIEGGFLYITFDGDALIKKGTTELTTDGKRTLKIIASALENNGPANFVIQANYNETIKNADAFETTKKKGKVVTDYFNENTDVQKMNILISSEKLLKQKLNDNDHNIGFVIYPPLGTITKFTE